MIVCICRRVSDRTIKQVIDAGARSLDDVTDACSAGAGCGACHAQIKEMVCCRDEANCPRSKLTVVSPYLALAGSMHEG